MSNMLETLACDQGGVRRKPGTWFAWGPTLCKWCISTNDPWQSTGVFNNAQQNLAHFIRICHSHSLSWWAMRGTPWSSEGRLFSHLSEHCRQQLHMIHQKQAGAKNGVRSWKLAPVTPPYHWLVSKNTPSADFSTLDPTQMKGLQLLQRWQFDGESNVQLPLTFPSVLQWRHASEVTPSRLHVEEMIELKNSKMAVLETHKSNWGCKCGGELIYRLDASLCVCVCVCACEWVLKSVYI